MEITLMYSKGFITKADSEELSDISAIVNASLIDMKSLVYRAFERGVLSVEELGQIIRQTTEQEQAEAAVQILQKKDGKQQRELMWCINRALCKN